MRIKRYKGEYGGRITIILSNEPAIRIEPNNQKSCFYFNSLFQMRQIGKFLLKGYEAKKGGG